ncbi:hypothetical protein PAI11_27470 [Patulibacter medicamentivorans]|uniref:Uncharacterized protein n=1 Tax=Patulibacter medicamentivorans TaxID=1097667 RepID=H0E7E5_9ACTN|nr:hypothetical protein [Patulibacter medicamentivorans]EHN10404.1 hypothetical protein PAI11_27470 [Patulibacter medicamentivorans]
MPGSLDFAGMLAALEGRRPPAPRHPLDELASAADIAGLALRSFGPEPAADPDAPVRPVVRAPRRDG